MINYLDLYILYTFCFIISNYYFTKINLYNILDNIWICINFVVLADCKLTNYNIQQIYIN